MYTILNSWERRTQISIILFALHYFILQKVIGYFLSFLFTNIVCILLLFYLHRRDGILSINYNDVLYSLIFIMYFISIMVFFKPPLISEFVLIFIQQASFEEIYFRFFIIEINRTFLKDRKILLKTLLFSNLFFTNFHPRTVNNLVQVFLLGMIFTYVFLNTGIVSSIIAHAIWNFYLPSGKSAFFVSPLFIMPILLSHLYPSVLSTDIIKKWVCG